LLKQYGVTRVADLDELLETSALFAKLPLSAGLRVVAYTQSGGASALLADVAGLDGVLLPKLDEDTCRDLRGYLPHYLSVENPVDNGGRFTREAPKESRQAVLRLLINDNQTDLLIIPFTAALGDRGRIMAEDVLAICKSSPKPIIVTWNSPDTRDVAFDLLVASGIPMFRSFRNCFSALASFSRYQISLHGRRGRLTANRRDQALPLTRAHGTLSPADAHELLSEAGLPLIDQQIVTSANDVPSACSLLRFPLVMKIASSSIAHKSDHGLVVRNVHNAESAQHWYSTLLERAHAAVPSAEIDGVLLQPEADHGVELLVGVVNDPLLGPAVSVGLGGIFAEVIGDVAYCPIPFHRDDVLGMLRSLHGFPLLEGARGTPKVDLLSVCDLVVNVGHLAGRLRPSLEELDLNPVIASDRGCVIVDSLIVLR
jgi:acetate---CoA ligase (ADP-forming)